jgi:lysine-N-methylase
LHTELGDKLQNNIFTDNDGAHFKMCKDGKCPMLTNDGLCEIILELGEEWICGICQMHPRFVNNFEHHTEIGVGLCCQAACELILTSEFTLRVQDDENIKPDDIFVFYSGEQGKIFELRNGILNLLEDPSVIIARCNVLNAVDVELEFQDTGKLTQILNSAEVLDPLWSELLDIVKSRRVDESILLDGNIAAMWRRLVAYFIFRYLSQACNLFEAEEYVLFSIISADFICSMGYILKDRYRGGIFEAICETARMYSCEIEYSLVNIEIIIDGIYSIE